MNPRADAPWPSVDPARLRHQIQILQQSEISDVSGANVEWVPFVTAYAALDPETARDVVGRHGQTIPKVDIPVTMNYQSGIKAGMHVLALNGEYIVQGIINVREMDVTLILACVAIGANNS